MNDNARWDLNKLYASSNGIVINPRTLSSLSLRSDVTAQGPRVYEYLDSAYSYYLFAIRNFATSI